MTGVVRWQKIKGPLLGPYKMSLKYIVGVLVAANQMVLGGLISNMCVLVSCKEAMIYL